MTIGIVGLGLIGGSIAKAYKRTDGITVLGSDPDNITMDLARLTNAIDGPLTDATIKSCNCIILAAYPQNVIDWLVEKAPLIPQSTTVIDCGGTKVRICKELFPIAEKYGFTFVGGHPMAGTHHSGFNHSREDLFDNAPMVIIPPLPNSQEIIDHVKSLLAPLKFGKISITTAENHDDIIAFSSQMPHIISNAFIKSPTALKHLGFSAGSYKDLSRVAWLNPEMWMALFLENKEPLLKEMDYFIESMLQYRYAIKNENKETLYRLLDEGRKRKKEVDG